jgi:hypothetical protein
LETASNPLPGFILVTLRGRIEGRGLACCGSEEVLILILILLFDTRPQYIKCNCRVIRTVVIPTLAAYTGLRVSDRPALAN